MDKKLIYSILNNENKYDHLQEKSETPSNNEFENFVNAYMEATVEGILTKPIVKPGVLWEILVVGKSIT